MPRVLSLLAVLVFFNVPRLIGEQGLPSKEDRCHGRPIGASCWMELSNQPGCYGWDSYVIPDETKTWMGECAGGLAQGSDTLIESSGRGHRILESTGRFHQGKQHGHWVALDEAGIVHEGPFVEGRIHGRWVLRDKDGNQEVVTFKNGERVG